MKLDRKIIRKIKMNEDQDTGFVPGTMRERMEMVWDITVDLWSIATKGKVHAETGLQRDVAVLIRGKG
jgi:hypothetical protein